MVTKGLDIADETSTFKIDLPEGGLILRDLKVSSLNIIQIEVVLIPESGTNTKTIQGAPTSLPTNEFSTERIGEIVIKVLQTSDNGTLKEVKLSVIACEEAATTTTLQTTPEQTTVTATRPPTTTTVKFCDETEYINALISTNSVHTTPIDFSNKEDIITKGVNLTNQQSTVVISVPNGGIIVRDVKLSSENVAQIEVTFTTESGHPTTPVRGAPTSLSTNDFPTEKVTEITIKVIKTSDDNNPKDVTLSVIACTENSVVTSTTSTSTPTGLATDTTAYISEGTGSSGSDQTSSTVTTGQPLTTTISPETTTTKFCDEMELVGILISNNAITTTPVDLPNKEDLIRKGVNFTEKNPIFVVDIPKGGVIVRDIRLPSTNVLEIEVTLTTESGRRLEPIQGPPTSLPKNEFPTEKVGEIIIVVKNTTDGNAPQDVTLSMISCSEDFITTTLASE